MRERSYLFRERCRAPFLLSGECRRAGVIQKCSQELRIPSTAVEVAKQRDFTTVPILGLIIPNMGMKTRPTHSGLTTRGQVFILGVPVLG